MKKLSLFIVMISFWGLNEAIGQWSYNSIHIYNNNSGNVGIGFNSPSTLLHVAKNTTEPTITVQNQGGIGGATYTMMDNVSGANWKFKATNSGGFKIRDHTFGLDVMTFEANSIANAIYINAAGNVGVRTTAPAANLHVDKTTPGYTAAFGPSVSPWQGGTNVAIGNDNEDAVLYVGQLPGYEGFLIWQYNANAANGYFSVGTFNGSNNMVLQEYGGKIGVHTTTPGGLVDVHLDNNSMGILGYNSYRNNYFSHVEVSEDGDGQASIFSGRGSNGNIGLGYGNDETNQCIYARNFWGEEYSFGLTGSSDNDLNRSGGVLGVSAYYSLYWGSLGYKNSSSNTYGGYFTSSASGAGKSSQPVQIGIGMGAWGDLFGADIHGKVYGTYTEGENYALFSHGVSYRDNLDVNLQENGNGSNTPLYTNVATGVTVMTSGTATLSGGKVSIIFDSSFRECVSQEEPVVVTVTPVGKCNGVFLADVTNTGCSVAEVNDGKSSATVNYIAIGKRAGYEKPQLSAEVIDAAYTGKLSRGLHNDNDLQTTGEGLYYENGQLVVGRHPSTLPDPHKTSEKLIADQVNDNYSGGVEAGRNR